MAYNKINWKNDYTPAINQDNLNYMDNGIYNAHKIIQTLLTGENYLGVFTPELALEYPATAVKGDSYYIGSLPAGGYTFTTGGLIGTITYNGDKIVYTGTEWSLVEHNEIIIGNVHTIEELLSVDNVVNTAVIVDGYTSQNDGNGGIFNWQDDVDKSTADGVDIVDPTVSIANQGTGVGLGCWIRLVIPQVFDERAAKKTEDRNGFNIYDARTVVELSFDDPTRTLSVDRKSGVTDYEIYCDNILYTINQDFTFTIDDTEGLFFIYFADGVLTHTHTFSYDLLLKHSLVAIGYWSVALQKGRVNFECHSAWYPSWLHILLHLRDGATYESGINITATVDGDGSSNDHIRFYSTSGYAQDEDLRNPIETKAITTNVANYYRTGADDWLWVEDPDCVVLNTGIPVYNAWSGTAWSLTPMTDGYYGVALIAVHPSVNGDSYVVIMGENQYANIADASEAAGVRPNTDGLPAPEYRFLEARVFKYDSTYTNTKKCAWVSLDTGKEYVDWRYTNGLGAAGGGLGAISSDDVTDTNTYTNFTPATATQKAFNSAVDNALGVIKNTPMNKIPIYFKRYLPLEGTTTATGYGLALTSVGTAKEKNHQNTNGYTRMPNTMEFLQTTASATTTANVWVTPATGVFMEDGIMTKFSVTAGVATGSSNTSHRFALGVCENTPITTDIDPSTKTSCILLGYDATDTTVQIMHNDNSGVCTKIDTGWAKPSADRTSMFTLSLWSTYSNGTMTWNYEAVYYDGAYINISKITGSITTNYPSFANYPMIAGAYISSGAVSAVKGLGMGAIGIEGYVL